MHMYQTPPCSLPSPQQSVKRQAGHYLATNFNGTGISSTLWRGKQTWVCLILSPPTRSSP